MTTPDETTTPAAGMCCGEHAPGKAGLLPVAACELCPKSPTYWRNEPGAAARLARFDDGRLGPDVP